MMSSRNPKPSRKNPSRGDSGSGSSRPSSGKHPLYRGIRLRSGKWVPEIREPLKTTRIWLGTFATPEMAAAAYDVAALALKGGEAKVNFRNWVGHYPVPESDSASDIRVAASRAASMMEVAEDVPQVHENVNHEEVVPTSGQEYVDQEEFFDYPNLMNDMAQGMLLSPPRMEMPPLDYETPGCGYYDEEGLWNYK